MILLKVNQWVGKNTNGRIKEIITEDDLADFVVILANALHFKAKWAQPFKALNTYKEDSLSLSLREICLWLLKK